MSSGVVHTIESLEHGGAEQVVVRLASDPRSEASVCTFRRRGALVERLPPGVEALCLGKGEGNDFAVVGALAAYLRTRQAAIVHSHAWGVFLETALAAWRTGVAHVHTVHGPYLEHGSGWRQRGRAFLRARLERWAARRCAAVVAVSDSVARGTEQRLGLRPGSVRTVHNGIEDAPPTRVGLSDRVPRLIAVGRLAPVKDHGVLLDAVSRLLEPFPRLCLNVVGDGPERGRLEAEIRARGLVENVRILGFRDDVDELLGAADVYVSTSRHEGISMAHLEAMRAGIPIVATRVGGVPETLHDGVHALLVEPGDARAAADAIARILRSKTLGKRLAAAAATRRHESFSVAVMRRQYRDLYSSVAGVASTPVGEERPLRILYHHRTQGRGAESVHVMGVVDALRSMGHDVTIIGPPGVDVARSAGDAPTDKADVRVAGLGSLWKWISRRLPGVFFELGEIGYNVVAWRQLSAELARQPYDLVYERYAFYMVAGGVLAHRRGVPFVLEANEVNGLSGRARRQWFLRLCGQFERFLIGRCAGVFVVSSYLRDQLIAAGAQAERVHVAANAVDVAALRPLARDNELARRLGVDGALVVGFVGWFDVWDRLDLMIDAVARLRSRYPALKAVLVGDGPNRAELQERVEALGLAEHVVMTGPMARERVAEHMALFDVALLPNSNEFGSPVVLFELMARRVPVVAPALGPIRDVLEDGRTALLFAPLDADDLVRALAEALDSEALRVALADAAYGQLCRHHTWGINARRVLEVAGLPTRDDALPAELRRAS